MGFDAFGQCFRQFLEITKKSGEYGLKRAVSELLKSENRIGNSYWFVFLVFFVWADCRNFIPSW